MKRILGIILFLFSFCLSSLGVEITEVTDLSKIHKKAAEAKKFVAQKGMNQDWCILIDFSYNLFTKRMFIYDLKNGKIIETALNLNVHVEIGMFPWVSGMGISLCELFLEYLPDF